MRSSPLARERFASPSADPAELLAAILDELRLLRRDLAARAPAVSSDDGKLGALLAAIHGSIADRIFSAGDLLIHSRLPIASNLHAAILAAVGAANARKVGKAMARAEGRNLGGLVVVRVDSDSTGILWSVRRV